MGLEHHSEKSPGVAGVGRGENSLPRLPDLLRDLRLHHGAVRVGNDDFRGAAKEPEGGGARESEKKRAEETRGAARRRAFAPPSVCAPRKRA